MPRPFKFNRSVAAATFAGLITLLATPARAGEVYANVGFPGVGLGYAHPIDSSLTLRGDFMTLGSREKSTTEEGINYTGKYRLHRVALFADWFPFEGSFRLTGGLSANNYKITLDASGAGGSLEIGDRTYTTTAADGITVEVKYPSVTPYLGIGWGHQSASGWRLSADIGALASQPDIQSNLDKETEQLRDGVGKVRMIPQLTFSVGYAF